MCSFLHHQQRKDRTMLKKMLFAAGAATLLFPVSAMAQDDLVVTGDPTAAARSIVVPIGDLNLRTDKAVRIADARVRSAAARVCGVGRMNGSVIPETASNCYVEAFGDARVDLNSAISSARAG
jgi:UrcA family protein